MRQRGHRVVVGLVSARSCAPPPRARKRRARGQGAVAQGLRFERAFGDAMRKIYPIIQDHPWFEFSDMNGWGFAQPDFILRSPTAAHPDFIFEVKLGNAKAGEAQLRELYLPIFGQAFGVQAHGIVVAKHLSELPAEARVCSSLSEAFERARGGIVVLHWREGFPL